jgi:hypothetical protein
MERVEVGRLTLEINNHADTCNHCNHSMMPELITSNLVGDPDERGTTLELVYRCTRNACSKLFISSYRRTWSQGEKMIREFKFQSSIPISVSKPEVPSEVVSISPSFNEIYLQAHLAESHGLNEVAGVGYRKALEFLIKDYCIYKNDDKKENIKALQLAKVIGQYVEDANIKACAKRAVWLGNDETHYVKKWGDKDISDLKVLIKLTVGWVQNCILTQQYIADMA